MQSLTILEVKPVERGRLPPLLGLSNELDVLIYEAMKKSEDIDRATVGESDDCFYQYFVEVIGKFGSAFIEFGVLFRYYTLSYRGVFIDFDKIIKLQNAKAFRPGVANRECLDKALQEYVTGKYPKGDRL